MPALAARSGAISPATGNKIRARDTWRKESLVGDDNFRRDGVFQVNKDIEASKLTDFTEIRSTSKSLALLKERVSRLGGGVGSGIGDGYHASPRVLDLLTTTH